MYLLCTFLLEEALISATPSVMISPNAHGSLSEFQNRERRRDVNQGRRCWLTLAERPLTLLRTNEKLCSIASESSVFGFRLSA